MIDTLDSLQEWYVSMCNGDWEHTYGITIETLDNPGWAITIELTDTPLYSRSFDTIKIQREDENDWILCRIENGVFKGDCGPRNLKGILQTFLMWAKK